MPSIPRPPRALLVMGGYGFASGLPLPLSNFTLRQWMSEGGAGLGAIGLTASIGLAYTLKFLWAPLLDQLAPPGLLGRLGQRRGWLVAVQLALVAACAALAAADPSRPGTLVAAAALVAFLSASQDVLVDAWRIESFPEREQGVALACYIWGYRAAMLVSGAGAIGLADAVGWHASLLAMAALAALGPPLTLLAAEPARPPRARRAGLVAHLRAAVVAPLREFMVRPRSAEVIAFVMLFKLGEALAHTMSPPFYRAMGFDRAAVAAATGIPSLAASLAGAAAGGWLVARIGAGRALFLMGWAQMATMGMYFALAAFGGSFPMLAAKIVVESFAEAMADTAFLTFLSGLCSRRFTATQYALLSSLAAVGLRTLGSTSGFLAAALGWMPFYALTMLAALPAMTIMLRLLRRPLPAPA